MSQRNSFGKVSKAIKQACSFSERPEIFFESSKEEKSV